MSRTRLLRGRIRLSATSAAIIFAFVVLGISLVRNPSSYQPTKIRLTGTAATQDASLQWDTGDGFNDYESKPISLLNETPRVSPTALLALARWLQRRHHASVLDASAADLATLASESPPQAGGADRPAGLVPARARPHCRR